MIVFIPLCDPLDRGKYHYAQDSEESDEKDRLECGKRIAAAKAHDVKISFRYAGESDIYAQPAKQIVT